MQAVTITQITPPELQALIENALRGILSASVAPQPEISRWLDLSQLCAYHPDKPARQTIYAWISAGTIPYHKNGKKLRFLKSEIDQWLLNGRKKTISEIAGEADQYLSSKRDAK